MTRAERKQLKQAKKRAKAEAKAEAERARREERRRLEEEKRARKAEKARKGDETEVKASNSIEALQIEETDGEARLTIRTSEEPLWLASERPEGGIVLWLMETVPGGDFLPIARETGIVAGVEFELRIEGEVPTTELAIVTRGRVSYSVRPSQEGLALRLRPARESVPDERTVGRRASEVIPVSPGDFNATLQTAEYEIGRGDVLGIEIFGLPELSRNIRVETNGTINFPVLGSVEVAGLSLREAEAELANQLSSRGLVNNPVVAMTVEELLSRGVSVQGAVNRPGVYQLLGPKTLLELLVETGGFSGGETASRTIYVLRRTPEGEQLRTEIDARRLVDEGDLSLDVALQPGDIVQVPQPQRVRVYVSGAVRSPGPIDYLSSEGITLLQAITAAGGPTERAKLGGVQVIRRHKDGTEERFEVDVKKIRTGRLEDFPLASGDTVVVREWFF